MSYRNRLAVAACAAVLCSASAAWAHVSVGGPAFVGARQVLTFGVGHGCVGADTYRVEITIPAQVTAVRALPGVWGEAEVTTNDEGLITRVAWEKNATRSADDQYYQFGIRITVPDVPFTRLYFPATQYCRNAEGEESMTAWAALPEDIEAAAEGEEPEPAPALWVLPPRAPGWNKYTVDTAIEDLSVFDDAQIVWSGDAAYSANPAIMELIAAEGDVEVLSSIDGGAEIWVKY